MIYLGISMKPGTIIYTGKTKKGKEIIIRYPVKTDAVEMQRYINALSKEQTFILFQGEQMTLKEETSYLTSLLKKMNKGESMMLLVFHNNQLIGESSVEMKERAAKHEGSFGISVSKEFRGEGIGRLLMHLTLEEAKKNLANLRIVTLGCFADNMLAYAMYKKFGFIEYGILPKGILRKRQYVDHIYLYKKV